MSEILLRNSTLTDVDTKLRLIDLIAVPWDEEADIPWKGEVWHESFERSAFDGFEEHVGRVRVNREHVKGDTIGKIVHADTKRDDGLLVCVKVANTPRGDETLQLADEDMLSPSIGYRVNKPSDVVLNNRTKVRRVLRAFLDHLSMVESPAYTGARVLAVRAEQSGLAVVETPLPNTPAIDEAMNDPLLAWARDRFAAAD